MELYDDQDEFFNLVQMTSEYKGIPEKAVEKDYLICKLLSNLAQTEYVEHCVFKGGTSLSKCYPGSIERFSEDIDLTYLPMVEMTKNIMGPLSRPLPKILRVPSDRTVLSSEAPKVELIRNLIA